MRYDTLSTHQPAARSRVMYTPACGHVTVYVHASLRPCHGLCIPQPVVMSCDTLCTPQPVVMRYDILCTSQSVVVRYDTLCTPQPAVRSGVMYTPACGHVAVDVHASLWPCHGL